MWQAHDQQSNKATGLLALFLLELFDEIIFRQYVQINKMTFWSDFEVTYEMVH